MPRWATGSFALIYDNLFLTTGYMILIAGLCALLAFGWRSRVVTVALLAILLPLDFLDIGRQSRQVMLFALFGFAFVRSDAVRFPWVRSAAGELKTAGPAWPIRLIQLQLTVLYGANAIAKSTPEYLSGRALMGLSVEWPNFRVNMSEGFLELGPLLIPVALAAAAGVLAEYILATAF